jgi:hypothetical protein
LLAAHFEYKHEDGFTRNRFNDLTDPTVTLDDFKSRLHQEYLRTAALTQSHARKIFAARISSSISAREKRVLQGKLRSPLNSLLERTPKNPFPTINDSSGQPFPSAKAYHEAQCNHFKDHFSRDSAWITATGANDDTEEGQAKRDSLLAGNWRDKYHDLFLSKFPPEERRLAASFLDAFKTKDSVTEAVKSELLHALQQPFTYEDFASNISQLSPRTAPGPSGLTASALQATPEPILRRLFDCVNGLWLQKKVPSSWQKRLLVAIKKKPNSTTIKELRPIMLLEVIRKTFLSMIYIRIDGILRAHGIFNQSQCGGLARVSTDDAILPIKNAFEAAWETLSSLHATAYDKKAAFDSPPRHFIALGWARLGIPKEVAKYFVDCDIYNDITPRSPYYLLHPEDAQSFAADSGVSQGDSLSCRSYIVIEDILLTFLASQETAIDSFHYLSPSGISIPQLPSQFVDDTYIFFQVSTGRSECCTPYAIR